MNIQESLSKCIVPLAIIWSMPSFAGGSVQIRVFRRMDIAFLIASMLWRRVSSRTEPASVGLIRNIDSRTLAAATRIGYDKIALGGPG